MAQLFSGEYNFKDSSYDDFLQDVKDKTKKIPNLNDISHGESFNNDNYNGYLLSLIAVKYIYDELGVDGFRKLMYNEDRIIKYGETILSNIFN